MPKAHISALEVVVWKNTNKVIEWKREKSLKELTEKARELENWLANSRTAGQFDMAYCGNSTGDSNFSWAF